MYISTFPGVPRTTYQRFGALALREKKFSQMDCYLDKATQKCCLHDLVVQNVVERHVVGMMFRVGLRVRVRVRVRVRAGFFPGTHNFHRVIPRCNTS